MAAAKKLLVLDLGMQSLRLAEFASSPGGPLQLLRAAKRDFLLDPSLDTTRPDQIRLALEEILKEWKLKSGRLSLILPAHTVFTKVAPVEVPGGNIEQIGAVVAFEAQHNIPFPLNEVIWDHVVMGQTPAGAVNVVFIAVKADLLEQLCKSIATTGLQIVSITPALLALYDAFRNACPEERLSSTSLLLDIGSRTSNLIISAPGSFYSRSIPSGGLAVTSAIAKDMSLELDEAETLKVSRGSVALGAGFAPPSDPVEANLAHLTRQALLKTQADINRSLSYYRSNLGGLDPSVVLITGGMASMPYLAEFFSEKLLKPCAFFEPLSGVSVADSSRSFVDANPNNLGELVGGALALTSAPQTKVNLLPPFLTSKRELSKRLPWLALAAALILISAAAWCGYAVKAASITREESAKLTEAISEESGYASQIEKRRLQSEAVEATSNQLLSLIQLRSAYPMILAELSARIPDRYIWITQLQPAEDSRTKGAGAPTPKPGDSSIKSLLVKGLYLENPREASVIDDFVTALQSSPLFVVDEKEKSKIITKRGSPNGEYWAYPFSLNIPLRTPITPLP